MPTARFASYQGVKSLESIAIAGNGLHLLYWMDPPLEGPEDGRLVRIYVHEKSFHYEDKELGVTLLDLDFNVLAYGVSIEDVLDQVGYEIP